MGSCEDRLTGRRDRVVLALLVGAGLRREELVSVRCEDLVDLPAKNGKVRWVLQINGKGDKNRVLPISGVLAGRVREWCVFYRSRHFGSFFGAFLYPG